MKHTQTEKIKRHLLRGHPITPMGALRNYGCLRLAARIDNLKKQGMAIATKIVSKDGKRFAQYRAVI